MTASIAPARRATTRVASRDARRDAAARRAATTPSASANEERTTSTFELERVVEPLIAETKTLNEGIAKFYDESSRVWEDVWGSEGGDGTHMHHGYYRRGEPVNHAKAQVDMIEESLRWAGVREVKRVLDVGCGIGGSSRHMVRKYGCEAEGVTLSPVQAARANALAKEEGVENMAKYRVADALNMPFEDGSFDFVWSMESGEHMPDKKKFVDELARVCAPGGTDFNRHVVSPNARAGAERAGAGGARFTRSHLRCVLPPGVVLDRRLQGARRGRRAGRHRNRGLERGGQAVLEGRDQDRVDAQGCDRSA